MLICNLSTPPLSHHPSQFNQGPSPWPTCQPVTGHFHAVYLGFILSLLFSLSLFPYHPIYPSSFFPPSLYLSLLSKTLPTLASPSLSSCCVVGLQLVLRGMSEALIDRRAAPALITLCSGPELWVKWHKKTSLWTMLFCGLHPYRVSEYLLSFWC